MKDYRNTGKSKKKNEFTWMVEHSKGIDKHMRKIHNSLRNDTLEELIRKSDYNMNKRYRQRSNHITHTSNVGLYLQEVLKLEKESILINLDKHIKSGRIKHNLLMGMYDEQYNNLPYFKRLFTKRIKSDYICWYDYEI